MKNKNNQLILRQDDYTLLISYLAGKFGTAVFDRHNADELHAELKKAKLVSKDDFPPDVVRLNSVVRIKADDKEETMEFSLVTPDKADIKTRRSPSWRQWVRH
jgi:regulator of nucleoside diphosphate kinase